MRIDRKAEYPVLYNRITKEHFIVVAGYENHVHKRYFLILFKVGENDYYTTIRGVYDSDNGKVFTLERILEQTDKTAPMSEGQINIIEIHYSYGLIHDIIKHDVRTNTKRKRKTSINQINMEI